ncbi:hypothetical protein ACFE04_006367 [Oxalis oulophora]
MAAKPCDDDKFGDEYLLLKPKEASWFDLGRLLFSSDSTNKEFFECPEEQLIRNWERRWVIFMSVFVQKLLLVMEQPLAFTGDMLEWWLNLLLTNGGFSKLILNVLTGKMMKPPEKWRATYRSAYGNLDTRIDLHKRREIGDSEEKQKGLLSFMAAKLAFENKAFIQNVVQNHWEMEFLDFFDCWNDFQDCLSTQAFILRDTKTTPNLIILAFRGTGPFNADQWRINFDISWLNLKNVGKIHSGYMKALGLQKDKGWPKEIPPQTEKSFAYYTIRQKLKEYLQSNKNAKFIVTGHSLGGSLAILFVALLMLHEEAELLEKLDWVFTFGQPRVGDKEFSEYMVKNLIKYKVKYFRYVYNNDMMPRLPFDDKIMLFRHFGHCLFYNSFYKEKVVREEPNKNYISLFWVIPEYLNAVWELVRGFFIPYVKGSEYRESWLETFFRLFVGFVIPGLSAHGPQDYGNCTRLGSFPSSLQYQLEEPEDGQVDPKQD